MPITAKMFDILLLMVRNSGRLITKNELMKTIWPNTIVEENNLTVSISGLRKLLSISGQERSYIETVSGHGYRFSTKVTLVEGSQDEQSRERSTELATIKKEEAIKSLAILPLENKTTDSTLDYLSDGITESIINILSRLPQLKVMARSTVFRYKGKDVDAQQIGRTLGVRAVLTGRVVQINENLLINIELVSVTDGSQVWGEQYRRQFSDILTVQEEVARTISERLRLKLTGEEERLLAKRYTENTEAYQSYLKGRYFWNKYNEENVKKGIAYFQNAIKIDPNYALAFAGLADSFTRLSNIHIKPKEALRQARKAALKAVELDPELAEAHTSLAIVKLYYDRDWAGAEAEAKRAIEISPRLPLSHQRYGSCLLILGRFDEAIDQYKLAQDLDPLSLQMNTSFGTCLHLAGRYEQAIEQYQKSLELYPNDPVTHAAYGWLYLSMGKFQEAVGELKQSIRLQENVLALGFLGYIYAITGEKVKAKRILQRLMNMALLSYVSPFHVALIYMGLGEEEKALTWLEKLYDDHSEWLTWLKIVPELESLRSTRRFSDLLRRVGFSS